MICAIIHGLYLIFYTLFYLRFLNFYNFHVFLILRKILQNKLIPNDTLKNA
jgi:hypothetical protein